MVNFKDIHTNTHVYIKKINIYVHVHGLVYILLFYCPIEESLIKLFLFQENIDC